MKFCGRCGMNLTQFAAARAPAAADPQAPQTKRAQYSTIMGHTASQTPPTTETPMQPRSSAASPPRTSRDPRSRTIMGLPAAPRATQDTSQNPPSPSNPTPNPQAPSSTYYSSNPKSPSFQNTQAQSPPQKQAPSFQSTQPIDQGFPRSQKQGPDPTAPRPQFAQSQRTVLGMAAPRVGQDATPAPQQPSFGGGGVAPSSSAPRFSATTATLPAEEVDVSYPSNPPKSRGPWVVLLAAFIVMGLLGVAAVAAFLVWSRAQEPNVQATVETVDGAESLAVAVSDSEPGTRVRLGTREEALVNGRAAFPIRADELRVGENHVRLEVLSPKGKVHQVNVDLHLDFRVRTDLAPLAERTPALSIVVDAMPGARVTVDGQSVALDGRGHGVHRVPVELDMVESPSSEKQGVRYYVRTFRYRVQPPSGSPVEETLSVRLPYATLQLDRGGDTLVTDRSAAEIAGAVHPIATVTVADVPVQVRDGRFMHRFEMPEPGVFEPVVVARQPGHIPRAQKVSIRRVTDLAAEAASFAASATLGYARLKASPGSYRGQNVALEGRVYNVDTTNGRTVLQLLARDCARGERCPLWVTYPTSTDVTVNSWVRVLGVVAGEQQFRSESDRIITVPRVDAVYVLPLSE